MIGYIEDVLTDGGRASAGWDGADACVPTTPEAEQEERNFKSSLT